MAEAEEDQKAVQDITKKLQELGYKYGEGANRMAYRFGRVARDSGVSFKVTEELESALFSWSHSLGMRLGAAGDAVNEIDFGPLLHCVGRAQQRIKEARR